MDPFIYRECRATITARIPDTPDADAHPDRVLVQGRGTAHPQFQGGSVVFTEIGEYAIPQPIPVVIQDGELLVEVLAGDESVEAQPLYLPVTVDERANQNWSWRLTFDFLTLGEYGEEVTHPPLSFPVEAGDGPLEISTVATPVIKSQGFVTRGQRGRGITSITAESGVVTVEWEGGDDVEIPIPTAALATPASDGLMPAGDKAKLDEVPTPASIATQVYVGDQIAAIPTATTTDAGLMSAADKARMRHTPQEVATPTDWRLAETDEDGKISRAVDAEGRTWLTPHPDTPGIADTRVAGQIQHVSTDDWAWAVADEAGQVALGVRPDGTTYTGGGATSQQYDVVLIIGQSNARGAGSPVPEPDPWAGIDQYPAANHAGAGTIIPAVDPLLHQDPRLVGAGFALPFARRYRQEHPDRQVLIVPAAYGATGFSTSAPDQGGTWDWTAPDDGTNLAVNAVRQTQDALTAAGSGARLVGILWHQGEGDGSIAADYHLYLDGLIAWLRDQLDAPDVPFVVGQMSPDRQGGGNGVTIDAAHQMTPARVERTAFAPTPPGLHNYGDATHLATRGLQKVGLNFFDALERAEFNTYGGGPIGVEDLRARRSGDTVTVEWGPAWCRVTEYRVEWRTSGGAWAVAGVTHSPSLATSATVSATEAVEVRVITVNETGESTPVHTSA